MLHFHTFINHLLTLSGVVHLHVQYVNSSNFSHYSLSVLSAFVAQHCAILIAQHSAMIIAQYS